MEVDILGKPSVFRGERSDELGEVHLMCMLHWVSYLKDWGCDEVRAHFSKHTCTLNKEVLVDSTWVETEALEPMILNTMVEG